MTAETKSNHDRVLRSARKLFFEKGFAATSTVDLAREAGTSKATIYAGFGSMEGLLGAVIAAEVDRFTTAPPEEIVDFASFRKALVGFGTNLLAFLNEPETIRFSRMMHEAARRRPDAAALYLEAAYDGTARRIEEIIAAGLPHCAPGPAVALPDRAERYMAMLKGHRYEMAVLGAIERPYLHPQTLSTASFDAWFAET